MPYGSDAIHHLFWRDRRGQMSVELAVCIPVVMAVMAIALNLMVFLGDCARFDRMAAEAVRTRATSPSADSFGLERCAALVEHDLREALSAQGDYLRPAVEGYAVALDGSRSSSQDGITFVALPHHEIYVCRLEYRPWGFGTSFFGIEFSGITHTRLYTVDPFRPGALL
ncbi:MAG: hypothetical protein LBH56_02570 [Coriobacteriales bacterium]|nr:hypothetical protein [Coriobacteriales bacterium]